MPSNISFLQSLYRRGRSDLWSPTGPLVTQDSDTVTFVANGARIAVHSSILITESPYFRRQSQNHSADLRRMELVVSQADLHTVWRTLQLIYCQKYTGGPCPYTKIEGQLCFASQSTRTKSGYRYTTTSGAARGCV